MCTINELCSKIINSGSNLEECITNLEKLKICVKEAKNKRTLIKYASEAFAHFMISTFYFDSIFQNTEQKNVKYVNDSESIGVYVSSIMAQVIQDNKISTFNRMIDTALVHLKGYEENVAESGEVIAREIVESILQLPLVKNVIFLLSREKPVLILNINYTCEFNSTCLPYIQVIVNSRSNPFNGEQSDPDYVFMHELGHLFNVYLTSDFDKIPESFGNVLKDAFRNDIRNLTEDELREVFADCFSIACAYETQFEKTNPFIQMFRREDSEYIAKYMKNLVEERIRQIKDNA